MVKGMNPITIYSGHEIFYNYAPFNFKNQGGHMMALLSCSIGVGCWLVIAWWLYKNNIFIKI